jgi:hypothetical protein
VLHVVVGLELFDTILMLYYLNAILSCGSYGLSLCETRCNWLGSWANSCFIIMHTILGLGVLNCKGVLAF